MCVTVKVKYSLLEFQRIYYDLFDYTSVILENNGHLNHYHSVFSKHFENLHNSFIANF